MNGQSLLPISILIIEDDPDDIQVIKRALQRIDMPIVLSTAQDGVEARSRLEPLSGMPSRLPDLIFLDLNLPGMDGRDLLTWLHGHQHLNTIPVVVLSGANDKPTGAYAWAKDDMLYFEKPPSIEIMVQVINQAIKSLVLVAA